MSAPAKPLPQITDENRPFWAGCLAGELRMQRCATDGHVRFPIQPLCPRCLSAEFSWQTLSGRGEVFSYVVYHRAFHPSYADDVPYNLAIIQLDEGPRMYSNIVGPDGRLDQSAVGSVRVGDAVTAVFDRVADDIAVPRFRTITRAVDSDES